MQGLDCSSKPQGLFTRRLLSRASARPIVVRNFGNAVAECAWGNERCRDSVGGLPRMSQVNVIGLHKILEGLVKNGVYPPFQIL